MKSNLFYICLAAALLPVFFQFGLVQVHATPPDSTLLARYERDIERAVELLDAQIYKNLESDIDEDSYIVDWRADSGLEPILTDQDKNTINQKIQAFTSETETGGVLFYIIIPPPFLETDVALALDYQARIEAFTREVYSRSSINNASQNGLLLNFDSFLLTDKDGKKIIENFYPSIAFGSRVAAGSIRDAVNHLKEKQLTHSFDAGTAIKKEEVGKLLFGYVTTLTGFITGDFTADEKTGDFGTVFTANLSTLPEGKKLNPDIKRAINIPDRPENEDKLILSDYAGLFGSIDNVKEFFREDAYMSVLLGGQTEFRLELIITSDESIRHQSAMGSTRFGKTAHQISYEAPMDGKTVRIGIHVRQKEGLFHWTLHLSKDIEDAVSFKKIEELYTEIDNLYRNDPDFDMSILNGSMSFPLWALDLFASAKKYFGITNIYIDHIDPALYDSYGSAGYFVGGMGDAIWDELEHILNSINFASDLRRGVDEYHIKLRYFLFKIMLDKKFKEKLVAGVNELAEYRELVFPYYYEIFRQKVMPKLSIEFDPIGRLEAYYQKLSKADNDAFYEYGYVVMSSSLFLVESAVIRGGGAITKTAALKEIASNIIEDVVKRIFDLDITYEEGGKDYFDDIEKISTQEISYPTDIKDINGVVFNANDTYTDVILHYNSEVNKYELWQEKLPSDKKDPEDPKEKDFQYIDEKELADKIKAGSGSKTNKIRLLSCSDLPSAQRLLKFLGQSYEMIASNHPVKLYHDGTVETIGENGDEWWEMKSNSGGTVVMGKITNPTPPITQDADPRKNTDKNRYVMLGVDVGGKHFVDEEELLSFFKEISIELRERYPAFDYSTDGCGYRATIMIKELADKGINCKKIFAINAAKKTPEGIYIGGLIVPSKYVNSLGKKEAKWDWHVSILVESTDDVGNVKKYVLDPALKEELFTIDEWLQAISPDQLENVTEQFVKLDYQKKDANQSKIFKKWWGYDSPYKEESKFYFETPSNYYDPLQFASGVTKTLDELVVQAFQEILAFNDKARIAKLATFIADRESISEDDINFIKSNYSKGELVIALQVYLVPTNKHEIILTDKIFPKSDNFAEIDLFCRKSSFLYSKDACLIKSLEIKNSISDLIAFEKILKNDYIEVYNYVKDKYLKYGCDIEQLIF